MNPQFWWYLTRSSGIVAWLMLTASVIWGVLLSTKAFPTQRRPAWLLELASLARRPDPVVPRDPSRRSGRRQLRIVRPRRPDSPIRQRLAARRRRPRRSRHVVPRGRATDIARYASAPAPILASRAPHQLRRVLAHEHACCLRRNRHHIVAVSIWSRRVDPCRRLGTHVPGCQPSSGTSSRTRARRDQHRARINDDRIPMTRAQTDRARDRTAARQSRRE